MVLILVLVAPARVAAQNRAVLESELDRLRAALRISSMSAAVLESGTLVWVRHFGVKPEPGEVVQYPVDSLTMPFAAALALREVERARLTLSEPVTRPDGVAAQVRQVLSHTAAGMPGSRFLFSLELYGLLQPTLETAAGTDLARALATEVIGPLGLRHTTAGAGTTTRGGLRSTVEDLARFASGIERGAILSAQSTAELFRTPRADTGRPFPHAAGWFVQHIGGEQVRWHFGESAEASGVLVNLPRRRLTFVVLARSDRLSSPFWLPLGDVRWSPAVSAFLFAWAKIRLDYPEARRLVTEALVALSKGDRRSAAALVRKASVLAPPVVNAADPVLLAAFARSGDAGLREIGRRIARRLQEADADHPRVLLDLAVLALQDGQTAEATGLLTKILRDRQATPEIERAAKNLLTPSRQTPRASSAASPRLRSTPPAGTE